MTQPFRRPTGGMIDRSHPIGFTFDATVYSGFEGDTLASALLANGVRCFGRSFKYHRPRGLLSAGVEEPNALVGVGRGGRFEPNTRATDLFLYEGLTAESQNRWPSLTFDLGAVNQLAAPFIPAGFYYKTFFGGPGMWRVYEHFIRRAAGLGRAPTAPDPDDFEHRAAFCDVLVVGSGPSGLAAAKAAAKAGARVLLVEQDKALGGSLLTDPAEVEGESYAHWRDGVSQSVIEAGGRILVRTSAAGYWDDDLLTLIERLCEPGQDPGPGPAQRLWRVRARRVVLATGAVERPLLFADNDRPGVMLSSAVRTYLQRFAIAPGRRAVLATCNDDAYVTARSLQEAGVEVVAVLDSRPKADAATARRIGVDAPVFYEAMARRARGGVKGVEALEGASNKGALSFGCDLVAVSGGFTPSVHLHMQAGGGLTWSEDIGAFRPVAPRQNQAVVGAASGAASGADGLAAQITQGWSAGASAAAALGFSKGAGRTPSARRDGGEGALAGQGYDVAPGADLKTVFLDYQNDVTAADVDLAWREGYRSIEHLKRYTTLGMATDQGKTSNLPGLMRLAAREGRPAAEVGVTTFRPPFTPVTLGALAGEAVGAHLAPVRRSPLHGLHAERRPLWAPSGYWMRPRAFPKGGEDLAAAALREAGAVRRSLGLTDVSTLAKFEIAGPDAAALLEMVCATRVGALASGRGRYTFMLREDGFVFDDGTVWRLGQERYLLTSSTGGADRMAAHIAYVRRVLAPELRVSAMAVQERWAAAALAGPRARAVVEDLLGAAAPAHMGAAAGAVAGQAVLVLAASYSGERAFEIYAPASSMAGVWRALGAATEALGGAIYGLEALELLRIEKGHIEVGAEIDGRRTPRDLGLHKMCNPTGGFLGALGLQRPALNAVDRPVLVGLEADDPIPEGAMLTTGPGRPPEGHVSSAGVAIGRRGGLALGLLADGAGRMGETLLARSPTRGRAVEVRVSSPHHYDPAGERYRD